jgi:hypothetical protein
MYIYINTIKVYEQTFNQYQFSANCLGPTDLMEYPVKYEKQVDSTAKITLSIVISVDSNAGYQNANIYFYFIILSPNSIYCFFQKEIGESDHFSWTFMVAPLNSTIKQRLVPNAIPIIALHALMQLLVSLNVT